MITLHTLLCAALTSTLDLQMSVHVVIFLSRNFAARVVEICGKTSLE